MPPSSAFLRVPTATSSRRSNDASNAPRTDSARSRVIGYIPKPDRMDYRADTSQTEGSVSASGNKRVPGSIVAAVLALFGDKGQGQYTALPDTEPPEQVSRDDEPPQTANNDNVRTCWTGDEDTHNIVRDRLMNFYAHQVNSQEGERPESPEAIENMGRAFASDPTTHQLIRSYLDYHRTHSNNHQSQSQPQSQPHPKQAARKEVGNGQSQPFDIEHINNLFTVDDNAATHGFLRGCLENFEDRRSQSRAQTEQDTEPGYSSAYACSRFLHHLRDAAKQARSSAGATANAIDRAATFVGTKLTNGHIACSTYIDHRLPEDTEDPCDSTSACCLSAFRTLCLNVPPEWTEGPEADRVRREASALGIVLNPNLAPHDLAGCEGSCCERTKFAWSEPTTRKPGCHE